VPLFDRHDQGRGIVAPGAIRIPIGEGERKTQDVKLGI
jgi:hypothetical protein